MRPESLHNLGSTVTNVPSSIPPHRWNDEGTFTGCLPEEMLEWLKKTSRRTGIPVGRLVRQSLETTLSKEGSGPLLEFAGLVKGGPRNVSSRKGFSRD